MEEDLLRRYQKVFSRNAGDLRNEGALRQLYVLETDEQNWPHFSVFSTQVHTPLSFSLMESKARCRSRLKISLRSLRTTRVK